ncbi:MAG: VC0807 family protein [Pseudomonadales bacterium]
MTTAQTQTGQKKPNLLVNLAFNIIFPTLIMTKLSSEDWLGPVYSIVVALSFPIGYGIWDYLRSHKPNFFSILGVISVLLTGGISLLQLDPQYIAIKEAAIPALFGIATLYSMRTKYPLIRTFLYNDQVLQIDKVKHALQEYKSEADFDHKLNIASFMVAGSFFMSSVLNYVLARVILVSEPGTVEFTEELGKMTAYSFPVIAVPSTIVLMGALFYLLHHIQKLTHLKPEDIFNNM